MTVCIKRVYEPAAGGDGLRVLVDGIWPQGISRYDAKLDQWLKEVAPSTELRRWFGHKPEHWKEFQQRYRAELKTNPALAELRRLSRQGPLTLLYAARDTEYNNAQVLRALLSHLPRRKRPPASARSIQREESSPVCYARDADPTYMGYLTQTELIDFLNAMLETERAGARVTLQTAKEARQASIKKLSLTVHREEAKWCGMLQKALRALGAVPSRKTGIFYSKAIAINDLPERLAFLNRGQAWVVRKLRQALPKVRDDALHRELSIMLASHEQNIQTLIYSGLIPASAH